MSNVKPHKNMLARFTNQSLISPNLPGRGLGFLTASLLALALITSCSSAESPKLVRLDVSASGAYTVDGVPVERAALAATLLRQKQENKELFVHVAPAQDATYEAIYAAVEAVQKAGGKTGMVGNEVFYPSTQSSSAQR